jgi:DNA polymerase elongation subunit (family B)
MEITRLTTVGWILDAYIQNEEAVIWIRTEDNGVLKLKEVYQPSFYVLPKAGSEKELVHLFTDSADTSVAYDKKYTMLGTKHPEKLLRVTSNKVSNYKKLVVKLETLSQVEAIFNTDLLHIQRYLFTTLDIAPTSKVAIEQDKDGFSFQLIDDSEEITPPPFTLLFFKILTDTDHRGKSQHNRITRIEVKHEREKRVFRGDETAILQQFATEVEKYNPDLLVCPKSIFTMNHLFQRAQQREVNLRLDRESTNFQQLKKMTPYGFRGRVLLDYHYFRIFGVGGLVERTRFSVLPPSLASNWTANRIIDSRNCYELLKRDYVIPKNVGYYEYFRSIKEVADRDCGGLIFGPKSGVVHENVAEFDFESEYPHLIIRNGLSYETVTPNSVVVKENALLVRVTEPFLDRRLRFKKLRKTLSKDTQEWLWCEQRQLALKMILVCLYGTTGCCWNRFGNVLCFEEINQYSRKILVKAKNFVQKKGFEVIYADSDSLFVKKKGATKEEYEKLRKDISQHAKIPITLDHHYKYLLLLPLESDPSGSMKAQKRYFGMLTNGELLTRGIECRRHDHPPLVKNFQKNLIRTLFDAPTTSEVHNQGYKNALTYIFKIVNKLERKDVPIAELVISQILRKPLTEYAYMFPHSSAAMNLAQQGKIPRTGEVINYVYVNAKHPNPLRRIAPDEFYEVKYYDKTKYGELVLDAAETVLSSFGFSKQWFESKSSVQQFDRSLMAITVVEGAH